MTTTTRIAALVLILLLPACHDSNDSQDDEPQDEGAQPTDDQLSPNPPTAYA